MKPTKSDHLSDADLALRGLSRETDLVLDAAGGWRTADHDLTHPGVVEAFSRWIERDAAGRYVLRNDLHYVYVTVAGAPLHARALEVEPGALWLRLQGGERERLRPESLRTGPDGALYADGRDGTWPIRLDAQVALALEPYLREDDGGVALELDGVRHPIPEVDDPLA